MHIETVKQQWNVPREKKVGGVKDPARKGGTKKSPGEIRGVDWAQKKTLRPVVTHVIYCAAAKITETSFFLFFYLTEQER